MKISDIITKLELEVFCGKNGLEREITGGYVSDLLSDVMGSADSGEVWITLQGHKNVMAIASLKELAGVILVNGIKPDEDTVEKADEEDIPIMGTKLPAFQITGKLYDLLKQK